MNLLPQLCAALVQQERTNEPGRRRQRGKLRVQARCLKIHESGLHSHKSLACTAREPQPFCLILISFNRAPSSGRGEQHIQYHMLFCTDLCCTFPVSLDKVPLSLNRARIVQGL